MKCASGFFQKLCKSGDCGQKFVPALFVAYLPWCHIGDAIDQSLEPSTFLAFKIPFDWRSFSKQFEPPFVEQICNGQRKVGGGSIDGSICFNLRGPNSQKGQQIGFSPFARAVVGVTTILGLAVSSEEMREKRDGRTANEKDDAGRGCVAWHNRRLCGWPDLWLAGLPAWQRPCS